MSSRFDKTPEPSRDPGEQSGHEDTSSFGSPTPSGHGGPPPVHGGPPAGYGGPPPGYGPPSPYGPPPGYGFAAPDHPRATTSLVLGILGLVLCQLVSPFAWVTSKRTLTEIDASGGRWGGRGQAQAGYVLGIVGTVLLGLAVSFLLLYVVVAGIALAGFATGAG